MRNRQKRILPNCLITLLVLVLSFFASLAMQLWFQAQTLIPSIFVLAVFLVSLLTDGYFYGIGAALFSMLAVNFAFTFPFFAFNFTIHENAVSAVIMIVVTVVTSTLTTKLKRQELLRAETEKEKMRANLLRAVSHDLRTPLTGIYGASSTVIDSYRVLDDESKLQLLHGIKEDSQWLIRMVENLLSVTRIDNSSVKLVKNSVVLEELVDAAVSKFKKRYPEQPVIVTVPEQFISVEADGILIEQVFVNLLENAVQHAEGMTQLRFSVLDKGDTVLFEVTDNGCGVDKEKLKTIFTSGNTASGTAVDSSRQSMGIGLSVCATIITAHGSRIHAENVRTGGMRFWFTLKKEETEHEQ